jgi:hypothetical protein
MPPLPTPPPPDEPATVVSPLVPEPPEPTTLAGQLKSISGLLALVAGLITILLILVVGELAGVTTTQFTTLATAAIGVVGAGVGAYFGVKVGSDGTAKAVQGQREEAAHAQVFAAHLDPDLAETALQRAFPPAAPGAPSTFPAGPSAARTPPPT